MLSPSEQNIIIKQVTQEILEEIKNSNAKLSNDEIREKISNRIKQILFQYEQDKEKENIKEDENIQKEFINIEEVKNDKENLGESENIKFQNKLKENNNDNDFKRFRTNYVGEIKKEKLDKDNNTSGKSIKIKESERKDTTDNEPKKFFMEISDIYKQELSNSITCFKNAFNSFKLIKNTSILEKLFIFILLSIPAILGGILTLVFILIVLLLWQFFVVLRVLLKMLESVESNLGTTIKNIIKKIDYMKKNGNLFNKLIFSNALYSVIMLNGALYMIIKGIMLPLKVASDIDKIVANFMSKSIDIVTAGLKGPSELALNNLHSSEAFRGNISKSSSRTDNTLKLQLKKQAKSLETSKIKMKDFSEHLDKVRELEEIKKNQNKKDAEKENDINLVNDKIRNSLIKENENIKSKDDAEKEAKEKKDKDHSLDFSIIPMSFLFSQHSLNDLNIKDMTDTILTDAVESLISGILGTNIHGSVENNNLSTTGSKDEISNLIYERIEDHKENYEKQGNDLVVPGVAANQVPYNGNGTFNEAITQVDPNFNSRSIDEKITAGIEFGEYRSAEASLQDSSKLSASNFSSINEAQQSIINLEKADVPQEEKEMQTRYGVSPEEVIKEYTSKSSGESNENYNNERYSSSRSDYNTNTVLTNTDIKNITIEMYNSGKISENQVADFAKDLTEYNCEKKEAIQTQQNLSHEQRTSHAEREANNSGRDGNSSGISM